MKTVDYLSDPRLGDSVPYQRRIGAVGTAYISAGDIELMAELCGEGIGVSGEGKSI